MFCAYTRPRYQVSVYRTIGPLVCFVFAIYDKVDDAEAKHGYASS